VIIVPVNAEERRQYGRKELGGLKFEKISGAVI